MHPYALDPGAPAPHPVAVSYRVPLARGAVAESGQGPQGCLAVDAFLCVMTTEPDGVNESYSSRVLAPVGTRPALPTSETPAARLRAFPFRPTPSAEVHLELD